MLKDSGTLIIQTYNPEDETLKAAATGNYDAYFHSQLQNRRLLSYPPYSILIKLSVRGKNKESTEKSAHQLFASLKSTIELSNYPTIQLLGPFEPVFFSKIVKFNIIIKYRLGSYNLAEREKAIQKLSPILKEVDKNVQITIDPASLN